MHQDSEASEPTKRHDQVRGPHMPRILVVDDDPMVCMAIEVSLERLSFQVTTANGGEAGLRALEGTAFDLMIVDIFMPHMRGFEFDPDFSRTGADSAADRHVGLRLCNSRLLGSRLPADGSRTGGDALSAQAVHAGGAAERDQRMSGGSPIPLCERRPVEIAIAMDAGAPMRRRWRSLVANPVWQR